MAKLKRLNRSDRAKHNAKLGDVVREISKSSGIIATKSGNTFAINDSADAPISGLRIFGRTDQVKTTGANLFNAYDLSYTSNKDRCIAETIGDGAIRVIVNNPSDYMNANVFLIKTASLEVGKVLYATANIAKGDEGNTPGLALYAYNTTTKKGSTIYSYADTSNTGKARCAVKLTEAHITNYDEIRILFYYNSTVNVGWQVGDYVDYSNIMVATSDIPYEPYTGLVPSPSPEYPQAMNSVAEGGSVGVDVYGKNLLNINNVYKTTYTDYRVEDNKLILKKTNTREGLFSNIFFTLGKCKDFSNKTFTVSITNESSNVFSTHFIYAKDGRVYSNEPICRLGTVAANKTTVITGTIPENDMDEIMCLRIVSQSTTVTDKEYTLSNIQVEYGTEATEYKPFNKKTATFPTPNGLRGIPVESGGNYADESGQQWVCDEIDVKNREFIVRIAEEIFDGNERWMRHASIANAFWLNSVAPLSLSMIMCEKYKGVLYARKPTLSGIDKVITCRENIIIKDTDYSATESFVASLKANPLKIQYILKEPIRIPLDDVYNLSTLQTYKPTTIVSNDAGAIVELSYYADKKNYIDQKFAELQALALENK